MIKDHRYWKWIARTRKNKLKVKKTILCREFQDVEKDRKLDEFTTKN